MGKKKIMVTFEVTEEEKNAFTKTSAKLNYHSLSEWIRRTLMDRVVEAELEERIEGEGNKVFSKRSRRAWRIK